MITISRQGRGLLITGRTDDGETLGEFFQELSPGEAFANRSFEWYEERVGQTIDMDVIGAP